MDSESDSLEAHETLSTSSGESLQQAMEISFGNMGTDVMASNGSSDEEEDLSTTQTLREILGLDDMLPIPSPADLSPSSRIDWRYDRDIRAAQGLRDAVNRAMKTHVCSVCACYQPAEAVRWCQWKHIPNVQLLLVAGWGSPDMPRSGHTFLIGPDGQQYGYN